MKGHLEKIILTNPTKVSFYIQRYSDSIKFCEQYRFDFEILDEIYDDLKFESNEAYITIEEEEEEEEEEDLVHLVQQIREKN